MTPSSLGCILLVSTNAALHSSKRQPKFGGLRYGLARGGTVSSPIVIATAVESGFGFLLTSTILYLVLSRGRRTYHFFFAAFLLICAVWDFGTFLLMIRNEHPAELDTIGYIISLPCTFIPVLAFHFANLYTGRPIKWALWAGWGMSAIILILGLTGLYWRVDGVYAYGWGNIFKVVPGPLEAGGLVVWFVIMLWACWLLFRAVKRASSPLEQRHFRYVACGFLVTTFSVVKASVAMGADVAILLPLGMFLNDVFVSMIGLAIVKDRLFDITIIVKKGALYSLLAALLIFVYSLSEHALITYVGEIFKEYSSAAHFISIAIGIAALLPVKSRIERAVEGYFAHKTLEF